MAFNTLAYGLQMDTEKYFGLESSRYIKTPEDLNRALADHKLDYTVQSVQMKHPVTGEPIPFYATMRTDTGAILGAGLSERYEVIQNADGFAMGADIGQQADSGAIFARGMTFDKGRVAAVQFDLGEMIIGDTGRGGFKDAVRRRLTWTNSHDGTGAAHIFTTPIRIVCANTLTAAISKAKDKISIRHTTNAPERMEEAAKVLKVVNGHLRRTEATYNAMAATKVNRNAFEELLNRLWPTDEQKGRALQNAKESKLKVARYFADADGGRIDPFTAWNAYNAITRYHDHDTTVRADSEVRGYHNRLASKEESRNESTLMGTIAKKNRLALEVVSEMFDIDAIVEATERKMREPAPAKDAAIENILSMVET